MSVRGIAARVTAREASALEVAQDAIARVRERNATVNAIVRFDAQAVLVEAAAVDRRLAAGETLALAGVPFTVKDNLWVEGCRVQQGSLLFDGFVAPRDAWAVARLRALGAVVLGITNCSEFACKGVTTNRVHGPTLHPADPALTPGGSSGGAAAALAMHLGEFALGTDAGGSIRRPAAHCGLVGLKPSNGVVPHPWGFAEPNYGLSVVGPLARNVADCALLFDLLAAFDAADGSAPPLAFATHAHAAALDPRPSCLASRIAWSPQLGLGFPIDADVLECLQARVDALRTSGWPIADADPRWPSALGENPLQQLQEAGLHALYGARMAAERTRLDPDLAAQIDRGAECTPERIAELLGLRERIARSLAVFFADYDLLLCPTAPVTAWPITQAAPPVIGGRAVGARGHAAFTPLFNICGVPAVSVPAGTVRGLPVGLQIVAPRFADASLFGLASAIEAEAQNAWSPAAGT